ncbi:hypothetical protein KY339_02720 [Candidatus Woesearchaeota archaeon]|nr:hypothetical protein [Candidatus Woesearchaeota archaeon]
MGPETAKLNLCLEQMLDCVNSMDEEGFAELESKYDKLMKKAFPEGGPLALEYTCMKNILYNCFLIPTDPVIKTSVYKVEMFLDKTKDNKMRMLRLREVIFETLKHYEPEERNLELTRNSIRRLDPDTIIEFHQYLINPLTKKNGKQRPGCPFNGKKWHTLGKKSSYSYKKKMSDYISQWGPSLSPAEATPSLLETAANYFEKNSSRPRLKSQQKI